jgi:hypothetical protein
MPFPFYRLDFNDIGAEVPEPESSERAGHGHGAIQNTISSENSHTFFNIFAVNPYVRFA